MHETMQESGLTEIILLICTSAIWDQYPVFSHPESPQGVLSGVAVVADGCNILCLLIMAGGIFSSQSTYNHPGSRRITALQGKIMD